MPIRLPDESDSKKPPRPGVRAAGCLGVWVGVTLLAGVYLWWANVVPPAPKPPAVTLPNPNGYDRLMALVPRIEASPGSEEIGSVRTPSAVLRAAVIRRRPLMAELRAILKLPFRYPPGAAEEMRREWPSARPGRTYEAYSAIREAAKTLRAEARLAHLDGRDAEGVDHGLEAMELGNRIERDGVVLQALVAYGIYALGGVGAEECIPGLDREQAHAAGSRLDRLIAARPSFSSVVQAEYFEAAADLQREFRLQPQVSAFDNGVRVKRLAQSYVWPKRWSAVALRSWYDRMAEEADRPAWKRREIGPPNDPLLGGVPFVSTLSVNAEVQSRASQLLLRVALGLEEYRGRTGAYPPSLQTLVGRELSTAPIDPFSGRLLVYRRRGHAYLLYSLGVNRTDDGGVPGPPAHRETGDLVFGHLYHRR